MKRILNNFKLFGLVLIILIMFNTFVTSSMVSKFMFAYNTGLWKMDLNNKFSFGTSFANLYGLEYNPFKDISLLDDDDGIMQSQEQQAQQSQQPQATVTGWDELEKDVANRIKKSNSSATDRANDLAAIYVTICQNWDSKFHYRLSSGVICGLLANSIGEGTAITREDGGPKLNTYSDMKDLYLNKPVGTGIFGFTDRTLKKNIWSIVEEELVKSGGNLSDSIDLIKASKWQTLGFIKYADVLKSRVGDSPYYERLKFDYPSTYSGDSSNPIISSNTTEAEIMCDWFCYHYERNLASFTKSDLVKYVPKFAAYDPIVEETSNSIGIITHPKYRNSRNNLFRRIEAKKLYDVLKDAPINVSSSFSSSPQSSSSPTIGQGNSIWILGDSRTMQLITYLDKKLKSNKEGDTKSLAVWSRTKTSPTYAKYKITENNKVIELNVFGIGSMGTASTLSSSSDSQGANEYKDYLKQAGFVPGPNNAVFLWFGINGGNPSNYKKMFQDFCGNAQLFQFSVPAGIGKWGGAHILPYDNYNSKEKTMFGSNYIDICNGDKEFTALDMSSIGTGSNKDKYEDGLHFTDKGYNDLWPSMKDAILSRVRD